MKNQEGFIQYAYVRRHLGGAFLVLACLLLAVSARADEILLIQSGDSSLYRTVESTFRDQINQQCAKGSDCPTVNSVLDMQLTQEAIDNHDLLVAVGRQASTLVRQLQPNKPQLHLLVFRQNVQATSAQGEHSTTIFMEQPLRRQLEFIQYLLPEKRRIGVLLGKPSLATEPELKALAQGLNLELRIRYVNDAREIGPALHKLRDKVDLILALPDARVYNRNTLSSILLATFRNGIPVIGFSEGMVKAGALAALHSVPGKIAAQAADQALQILQGKQPANSYPVAHAVAVNRRVARSLHLNLPTENDISKTWEQTP